MTTIVGSLLKFVIGGGWGRDAPSDGSEEVKVVRGADFPQARFQDLSTSPVRFEDKAAASKRSLRAGDIIFEVSGGTRARPTGRSILITDEMIAQAEIPVIPASFCRLVRPNRDRVHADWLFYRLQAWWNDGGAWAYQNSSTGISNFRFKEFEANFAIFLPSRNEQEAVAGVLRSLDDKIAANRWVIARAERLRSNLWLRALQKSELWPLSTVADFVNGGAYTKGATGTGRVVIRIAELNSGIGSSTVYNELDVPDKQIAHPGDLLMAWSGSLTVARWYRDDAIVNQHIFKVLPRENRPLWAVACAVDSKLEDFREIAAGKATTMGHIKRADLDAPVAWPEISDALNEAGSSLWERALSAERENLRLAATRDELLPLLMNGRITVKDAEKTVEDVV